LTLAMMDDAAGDLTAAEAGYRRVLEKDPKQPIALNNLAMVIFKSGGDMTEADTLASSAVEVLPRDARFRDTLASIQAKRGDLAGAIASAKLAVQLEPGKLRWLLPLVDLLVQDGQLDDASSIIKNIEKAIPDPSVLPESMADRLQTVRAALDARRQAEGQE